MFARPRNRVQFSCGDEMVTKQSHKDECDIHKILKQYQKTGVITHVTNRQPTFVDLPDEMDYQAGMNTLLRAQDAFAELPATVRDHFANDPARFLGAFNDPAQHDYLRAVGLLNPKKQPAQDDPRPAPGPSGGSQTE